MKIEPRTIDEKERIGWLTVARSKGIGPKAFLKLISSYESYQDAIEHVRSSSIKSKSIEIADIKDCQKEVKKVEKFGAKIISILEPEYPDLLREISDPPAFLTIFGKIDQLHKDILAIVGSRNASLNGCRFACKLAKDLGNYGFAISSGLARGIDTNAHKGSLDTGTIAVVAGGIDKIYPPENKDLFYQIAESGAVISEMPFASSPKSQNFPRRNRIISGISKAVIIVEANLRSGSLITSKFALEQNKEVMAVPGSPMDPRCLGPNSLIKQGAHLIENASDVIDIVQCFSDHANSYEEETVSESNQSQDENDFDEVSKFILSSLSSVPIGIDDVIVQSNLKPAVVINVISELELAGKLERHYGNKVSLVCK